jgi:hypothetical protein
MKEGRRNKEETRSFFINRHSRFGFPEGRTPRTQRKSMGREILKKQEEFKILELEEVCVSYGGIQVLQNINIVVEKFI